MSALALIVGIAFIGIGLFIVIPSFGAIGLVWTLIAVGIAGYHGFNLFSESGIAHEVVDFNASSPLPSKGTDLRTPEQRLAKLDELKRAGAITESEYLEQRSRVLSEI